MDMNGRILLNEIKLEAGKFTLVDVSNLSNGVYFINVLGKGISGKFVKE